jgi:hypothetical protein
VGVRGCSLNGWSLLVSERDPSDRCIHKREPKERALKGHTLEIHHEYQKEVTVTHMNIAKTLKRVSLLFVLLFPFLVQPTSALGYSTAFNTCAQMKRQYRFGVALSLKIAGEYPAKISKLIYTRNEGLDFDYDGIVCENELLQNNLNPSTKSTTATSSPVVNVTTIAPVATSPQYVSFRSGGSAYLRSGVTYQIYTCTSGASTPKYVDILSITTGWTQRATGLTSIDTVRCTSPGFPYIVSFGWIVTEVPGQVTRMRLRGFSNTLEMTVVISN